MTPGVGWLRAGEPSLRLEAHYGDRVIPCFADRPRSLYGLLAEAAAREPEREALVCGEERLSWREVEAAAGRVAACLRDLGIRAGDRVALLLGNRTEFVLALFGAARLGAVAVPMGVRLQTPEIAYALAHSGAKVLIHEADLAERLPDPAETPALAHRLPVPGSDALLARTAGPPPEPEEVDEEDAAVILYTSGTTGRPKGAMLTHLNIISSALVYEHCMDLGPEDRSVAAVPLSHVTGLVANLAAMARVAGTLVILPAFKAADFLRLAAAERMTATIIVPAMYNLCLLQPDFGTYDLSAWRVGGYGGAPMPPPTIERLAEILPNLNLMNAYGATETASPTTLMPPALTASRGDSVGRAVPGARVIVVDDEGRELPPGEPGEIWIHGPSVVRGYLDDEAATKAGFIGGWWRSGDIGTVDEDGFVRVLDRKKDMINRGGHKIFTAEVETVLAGHPAVVESAVVAVPCPVLGERVHAFVTARDEAATPEALRAWCAARLSDYKVPETVSVGLDPLPRNANGKLLKRVLRERVGEGG